ncbi:DUF4879 domain-containing protein [Pseudoalteromonas distincta]|uniref:DUF4879 domain-containing protein n=1 Tax=Pseudoalteromonas distincta TaxID=77608 RepID=UPI0032E35114
MNISEYDSFAANHPLDLSQLSIHKQTVEASASGIQYFEVYAVGSTNKGFEDDILPNQTATNEDHGGSQIRVAVIQYGYGNINNATFGGQSKSFSESVYLCGTLGVDVHNCNPGETVTGWLYYFNFSGPQQGSFSVSSNSTSSPSYWSDSIYIQ